MNNEEYVNAMYLCCVSYALGLAFIVSVVWLGAIAWFATLSVYAVATYFLTSKMRAYY